ncbi:MAG TPA: nitroreductase/quinone reductase family protein [Solirubrobacterales bacterium]|nr:nitroreductase/quinone reductase family protein [Solirubrobacterales bacterium]
MQHPGELRYVDPRKHHGVLYRAWARSVATPFGLWLSRHIGWKVDPYLLRLTRGRIGTGLIIPTLLIETIGARSGQPRRNGVIYFHDGERVIIVASHAGRPTHPSWFFNARANPDVKLNGRPYRAEVVEGEAERGRLWELGDRVFPPFATYRKAAAARSGRDIPIIRLTAVDGEALG